MSGCMFIVPWGRDSNSSVTFPVTSSLHVPSYVVLEPLFPIDRGPSLDVGPGHACIAPLVSAVVFRFRHHVFGLVRVMLHDRYRADRIGARVERDEHRPTVRIANKASPKHIPPAHRTGASYPLVVSLSEMDPALSHSLRVRRPAVLLERRRVKDAMDAVLLGGFPSVDAFSDFFRG
jgi:hypothetical protein